MTDAPRLLLLAGSAEARVIAQEARALGWDVAAWVSEAPRGANPMSIPTRLRSFDDADALRADMADFDAVIDASHGFDAQMTRAGWAAACALDLPFIRFARPLWPLEDGWQSARDVPAAMALIGPNSRVFSATGWASLPGYAAFPGAVILLRQTSAPTQEPPFDFVELIVGTPPFSVASETALFSALQVDTLIARNLGGAPSRPKLEAAKALGCNVILIDPPERPKGVQSKDSIPDILNWLTTL